MPDICKPACTQQGGPHPYLWVPSQLTKHPDLQPSLLPYILRPCPSVGPLGTSLSSYLSCTSLYWHLYLPRQFGKHAHPYMFTHTTIIHIIKMKILLIKVKNQFITNKNSKMELVDLMLKFLWLLKYVRISNFIKEEEKWQHCLVRFKIYDKALVIKTLWYESRNRKLDKWYRNKRIQKSN